MESPEAVTDNARRWHVASSVIFIFFSFVFLLLQVESSYATAIPVIEEYIRVENQSPHFDPDCLTNGLQEKAIKLIMDWILAQNVKGLSHQVVKDDGRTPVVLMDVPANNCETTTTVLMYGHMDKQPPMTEAWGEGLHPHTPVTRDGKLYGRGGADDGYSAFAAITAIKALQAQNASHPRIVVLIEAAEESGSPDLEHYIDRLSSDIGDVGLIVCLDSGCGNYEQLWVTASLRGVCGVKLRCDVLQHGVHSGASSGIVPSSFRAIRYILDQIEDAKTGKINVPEMWVDIPKHRIEESRKCAEVLGPALISDFPFVQGVKPVTDDLTELLLNKCWRPTMSTTGVDGVPTIEDAGNVLRAQTSLKLSFRLPPTCDAKAAAKGLESFVAKLDVPSNIKVTLDAREAAAGWNAPQTAQWLLDAAQDASQTFWGKDVVYMGEGGSIPFMGLLGRKFPKAQVRNPLGD